MFRFGMLIFVMLGMQLQAQAGGYVGVVKDFSQPAMGKYYLIQHQDGSNTKLNYPETRLKAGDIVVFPEGLKPDSTAWVEVQIKGKTSKIHVKDSPWHVTPGEEGVVDSISSGVTTIFAWVFPGESKSRYTQAMNRGGPKAAEPLGLPFDVNNAVQLMSDHGQPHSLFWIGGKRPFSLQVTTGGKTKNIADFNAKNEIINGKLVRIAMLPMEQGSSAIIHYVLRDKDGPEMAFDIMLIQQVDSIDEALIDLDNPLLVDGRKTSRRLMLWNATASLPETSSRRAMLRWMLLNREP